MLVVWILFFGTSLYGHIVVKLTVTQTPGADSGAVLLTMFTDLRSWSAAVAWGLSAVLWSLAVARHGLMTANAIASFRYVVICVTAWTFLSEEIRTVQAVGLALIVLGIAMAAPG
jgi:uncharacterized membrane protein